MIILFHSYFCCANLQFFLWVKFGKFPLAVDSADVPNVPQMPRFAAIGIISADLLTGKDAIQQFG